LLLLESANLTAAHGQMQKAQDLMERSVQATDRIGYKDTSANTHAGWALTEAEVGNASKAREFAASSVSGSRGRGNLESAAIALAMAGDGAHAQAIIDDLSHRYPADALLHSVSVPEVAALIALNRKAPDQAIDAPRAAAPYELGISQIPLPNYLRGMAYLQAKCGADAAAEFQKIIDHRGIVVPTPEHSLAKLGIGRAYVLAGDTSKAKAAYQDFFALWKDADPDVPILKEAKAEYAKLP
jgi:hypothetical protein